jgi:hypothetical protein
VAAGKKRRTARRRRDRLHEKLARDLDRLARLEPGGAPERPLPIASPAVVDVLAVAKPCPLCGGPLRLEDHAAVEIDGTRLRVASVACTLCRARRALYFRLSNPSIH